MNENEYDPPPSNVSNAIEQKEESSAAGVNTPHENSSLIPFYPKWAFGIDVTTKVINLTRCKNKPVVCYTVSHAGVIYNYPNNEMRFMMGHTNYITSISSNSDGKWLATADCDKGNSVIIWDSEECFPVHTIFNPHADCGTDKVGLSGDAKYLVTVGKEEDPIIKFWLWTYGRETEDDSFKAKASYGEPKDIVFHPNKSEHFLLTFEELIVFCSWDGKSINPTIPTVRSKKTKNLGSFMASIYIENAHECISTTSNGWIVVWGNTFYTLPFESAPLNNDKFFIKAIRLQKSCITTITYVDGIIVTGDVQGNIKFYDRTLKILYWCQNFELPPIVSICFNIDQKNYVFKDPLSFDSERSTPAFGEDADEKDFDDRSSEYELIYAELLPQDYTLHNNPFVVRDFVVLTNTGLLSYVHFLDNTSTLLISGADAPITSMAVHDEKNILCIGYANGKVCSYDCESFKLLFNRKISKSKDPNYNIITSIKYSAKGLYMVCGTAGGHLWFLDPIILTPYTKRPFIYDHSIIKLIAFSPDNKYVAYFDSSMAVCLLKREDNNNQSYPDWVFHGRIISHFKPIVDMIFVHNCRLFSIGEDRYLNEYNVTDSEPGKLELKIRVHIFQQAIPKSFILYEDYVDSECTFLIIATDEYKYYIINDQTFISERTILVPCFESPIEKIYMLPHCQKKYMIFSVNKYIGIQSVPLTGNPYKNAALIGHASQVTNFCTSYDGKYVFIMGENDHICLMWEINVKAVDNMTQKGGKELNPYYCLIDGGADGWLFQEMKDLFYYMQILHQGENSPLPRKTSNKIPTSELPNYMRSIGFYPTEYGLDNLLYEVKFYWSEENMNENIEEITFENVFKLYINHRPAFGFSIESLKEAFNYFADSRGQISREKFVDLLCTKGEKFTDNALHHCLKVLTNLHKPEVNESESSFNMLPDEITFHSFVSDILGIEMPENNEIQNETTN